MSIYLLGRRACIGENLAKMEVFLYFASLLQNFLFSPADSLPSSDGIQGITRVPPPFTLIAESI